MDDLINRQDVLELIDDYNRDGLGSVFFSYADGEKFKNEILALPSAQKTGHWIDITGATVDGCFLWVCSECGDEYLEDTDYCPSCGCRMEREEE